MYRVSGTKNQDSEKVWRILVPTLGSVLIDADRVNETRPGTKNQHPRKSFLVNLGSQAWDAWARVN